jgi:hypothetical protein
MLPIILITAIIIRTENIIMSIVEGFIIGVIAGASFYVYLFETRGGYNMDWGFFNALNIGFTMICIISSILGIILSYLVRKQFDKMKTTSK